MEDKELEPVNCVAAVRAIKDAGIFMLLDRDGCHYLVTKFNSRTKMDREGLHFLRTKTNFPVFHNVIHISIKVKESVFQHRPVVEYARKCRPAQDYRAFVAELVPNLGTEQEGALA